MASDEEASIVVRRVELPFLPWSYIPTLKMKVKRQQVSYILRNNGVQMTLQGLLGDVLRGHGTPSIICPMDLSVYLRVGFKEMGFPVMSHQPEE